MEKLQIIVCAHKQDSFTRNEGIYKAVQVGKALHPELDLGFLKDNEGDNISEKNPSFCELTGLYWAWKNLPKSEYIGLCHYRRYFDIQMSVDNIDKLMKGKDILCVNSGSNYSKSSRAIDLMLMTSQEDYYVFADIFLSLYPKYKKTFMKYFYYSRKSYPYQMFVMRWDLFDEYCDMLFKTLFEMESRVKSHNYSRQKRSIGYFGEWFLGLFIYAKNLAVIQVPLLKTDASSKSYPLMKSIFDIYMYCAYFFVDLPNFFKTEIKVPEAVKVGLKQDGIILSTLN